MAYFQAKIRWKRLRKRENKNYHTVSFQLDALQKISKKLEKKFKKLKSTIIASFQAKQVGKVREREKIKIFIPFRSYPTSNRKFQKNSKKIQKTKKYHYGFISSENRLEKDEKERK